MSVIRSVSIVGFAIFFSVASGWAGEDGAEPLASRVQQLETEIKALDLKKPADLSTFVLKSTELMNLQAEAKAKVKAEEEKAKKEEQTAKEFAGFNWGLGLAYTYIKDGPSIDEAKLIDGRVRILKEHKRSAALMFESHYFIDLGKHFGTITGVGPYAAIRLLDTEGKEISAYGVGLMAGFKRQEEAKSSWNIGAGYFVDTRVRRLGSGISEGEPLPGTETEIRYKDVDSGGFMFMFSATF